MQLIEVKDKLEQTGINVSQAVNRFCNNESLLMKFLEDTTFDSLKEAMNRRDYEEAFKAAHTLKGVTGNLSMDKLFGASSELVEFLRHEEYEKAEKVYPEVEKVYKLTIETLEEIGEMK